MAHTVKDRAKLLARVRRIRGQIEAVERALVEDRGCADTLQLISAARGAMNGLMSVVVEEHIRAHVLAPSADPGSSQSVAAGELIDVVRSYMR